MYSANLIPLENESTILGPPKLAFTSASRNAKASENTEKRGTVAPDGDLGERFPRQRNDRWSRDRDAEGGRDKTGYTNGRRAIREEGEGWTNVKGRKSLGQDDFDQGFGRNGVRDREKAGKDAELEGADNPPRRTGGGVRDKFERWGRRDDTVNKDVDGGRIGPSGQGGWRDREQNRDHNRDNRGDRNRDRDWTRGETRVEENPEWMDTQTGKEKKKAHTQEEFQRWKESMRAKDNPTQEREEPKVEAPAAAEPPIPTPLTTTAAAKSVLTPSAMEPLSGGFFGNWAKERTADGTASPLETGPPKAIKDKKSKFMQMQMFKKTDEPPATLSSLAPMPPPIPQENASSGQDADKEGFQRILQMLGGTSLSGGSTSQQGIPSKEGHSGLASLIPTQQSPPPDERKESRQPRQQVPRTLEQQMMLENILSPKPSGPEMRGPNPRSAMSPENALYDQFGPPRQDHNRAGDDSPFVQPPPRNSSAQDINLQALLSSRTQQEMNHDEKQREREFLLNLMQQPSRATPPQQPMSQPTPGRGMEGHNMSYFDQGGPRPMQPPKGRPGPPPGFMDDPRFLQEQQMRELSRQQEEILRAKNSRINMGFNPALDDPAIAHLQRRNTGGDMPRQMTNMGIPSQPHPDMQMFGRGNAGMPPTPQERPNVAPPPGFNGPPGLRGPQPPPPPGLGNMNGPQIPFPGGNPPIGHPPGFVPPPGANMGRGGMFPGGPGQNQMPPQGFFPPPNFAPPMGMRGVEDPRMMMGGRPDFEQYGAPGPRGRPPNMF